MKMSASSKMKLLLIFLQVLMIQFPHSGAEVEVFDNAEVQSESLVFEKEKSFKNISLNKLIYLEQGRDPKLLENDRSEDHFNFQDAINSKSRFRDTNEIKVSLDTSRIIGVIEDHFISYAIDPFIMDPSVRWLKFNFSSSKIYTLLTALSPSILRVGGSPADWLFFNKPIDILGNISLKPSVIVMSKSDITNLVGLTRSTGNRLLFDLNLQLRFGLQWNPSNAIELLQFCSEMGFGDNMDWELGNEPEYDTAAGQMMLTPGRIGSDFVLLKSLLALFPNMARSSIVGPDVVGTASGSLGLKIIQGVANASGSFLKAITFHHYYFRGDVATYKDYLNPNYFANLASSIQNVRDAIKGSKYPNLPYWLGETSDAWHSGTENVSDRFVSGFLWLDKLGLAAKMGVQAIVRQTLYGHDYALLDINMDPNPDYWLSWLHRLLVGNRVLSVELSASLNLSIPNTVRVYAHCTNTKSYMKYRPGSVTLFGLNMDPNETLSIAFSESLAQQPMDSYLLESDGPDGILSRWVKLNGKRLSMPSDIQMPDIQPQKLPPTAKVLIHPLTFGFLVFPEANIKICQ